MNLNAKKKKNRNTNEGMNGKAKDPLKNNTKISSKVKPNYIQSMDFLFRFSV